MVHPVSTFGEPVLTPRAFISDPNTALVIPEERVPDKIRTLFSSERQK
jgi:hypothetical protein